MLVSFTENNGNNMTEDDLKREAAEHLRLVGPKRQIIEAIDGMIEAACDGLLVKLGYGCGCDPALTHDYAVECLRIALEELRPSFCRGGRNNGS